MTGLEIAQEAQYNHTNKTIDNAYAMKYINGAKRKLTNLYDTACEQTTTTITCSDSSDYYDLPSDCLRIYRVRDSDSEDYSPADYSVELGQIKFNDEDTYTVRYLKEYADISSMASTPGINAAYHTVIALYVAALKLQDLEPDKAAALLQQFYTEAKITDNRLKRLNRKGRIPAPPFR